MYADIKNVDKLQWVETKLSELEQFMLGIINRILDAPAEVTMTSEELILLRKFLLIMLFRRQYTENRFCEVGKTVEEKLMRAKGRITLDDVWLENMRCFLTETVDDALAVIYFDVATTQNGDINIGYFENCDYHIHNTIRST